MTPESFLALHARTLPMALGRAMAVLAVGVVAVAVVGYLFYRDYRGVFREVEQ